MCDFDPSSENDARSQIVHMKKIQAEGLELFIKKNSDYGSSYKQYGLIGVLVRLQDKINRALHISQNGIHVKDESLRDTLIDLHNYAAMALMESDPMVPTLRPHNFEPDRINSEDITFPKALTPVERAALPTISQGQTHIRTSISEPPIPRKRYDSLDFNGDEAYDECNHRNINLR